MGGQGYTFFAQQIWLYFSAKTLWPPRQDFEPVPYSDTKSYQNLLVDVYGGENSYFASTSFSSSVLRSPIQLGYGNIYRFYDGNFNYSNGSYWLSVVANNTRAHFLYFYSGYLRAINAYDKGAGMPIRCLVH